MIENKTTSDCTLYAFVGTAILAISLVVAMYVGNDFHQSLFVESIIFVGSNILLWAIFISMVNYPYELMNIGSNSKTKKSVVEAEPATEQEQPKQTLPQTESAQYSHEDYAKCVEAQEKEAQEEKDKRTRAVLDKVVLEAERQAKVALDKVEKYAVLALIDKKELTIPFLNIKAPVQEAMNAVKKELAIPIPTIIGQKAWREERVANIYAAIKALVVAINAERDRQNEGVRKSVNKTYTYYMQNLNKQIEENKLLRAENDALKTENNKVKQRISQLDEKAVERVTTQLVCAKEELASANSYNTTLMEMYNDLKARWNAIWQEPEMTDVWRRVEARRRKKQKKRLGKKPKPNVKAWLGKIDT